MINVRIHSHTHILRFETHFRSWSIHIYSWMKIGNGKHIHITVACEIRQAEYTGIELFVKTTRTTCNPRMVVLHKAQNNSNRYNTDTWNHKWEQWVCSYIYGIWSQVTTDRYARSKHVQTWHTWDKEMTVCLNQWVSPHVHIWHAFRLRLDCHNPRSSP